MSGHVPTWTLRATVSGTSYDDTSAVFGTGYGYRVRAVNAVSTGEYGEATGWLAPVTVPTVTASAGLYTYKVGLKWDLLSAATGYEAQRSLTTDFGAVEVLGTTSGTSFDDTTGMPGVRYYYRVRAYNSGGLWWLSGMGSGWRKLSPPTGLWASQGNYPVGIRVEWVAVSGAETYEVWVSPVNDVFQAVRRAEVSALSWADTGVDLGATRYYWLRARSAPGVSDYSFAVAGWAAMTCRLGGAGSEPVKGDFDGDGRDDPAVYDAATGRWQVRLSSWDYAVVEVTGWGGAGSEAVAGDYDGDGRTDPAVYNASAGAWQAWLSGSGYASVGVTGWGGADWAPVPSDYDGDGRCDPAVYNAPAGAWRVWLSGSGYGMAQATAWGGTDWAPVPSDYDGDGRCDPAVYNAPSGAWQGWLSGSGYGRAAVAAWGGVDWTPVAGDFDGDGLADPAVYDAATGRWQVWLSGSAYRLYEISFGGADYDALALDFYGAGAAVPVIYGREDGVWWVWE